MSTFAPLVAVFFTMSLGTAELHAATHIEIVVDELLPDRSVPWPITTGIPFPRGSLTNSAQCRLVDDTGREKPLQSRVTATWDAQRTSVRWLTIDFIAEPGRKYLLEFGPDVHRALFPTPLKISDGDSPQVSTGSMTVTFSKTAPSAMGAIRVDLDQNGRIDDDEIVASGASNGEHYCILTDGSRASSAEDGAARVIEIEETGPIRACLRVDGFYTEKSGRRTLAYRSRYHFFAGLGLMKLIDEFRVVGSTKGLTWKDVGFALDIPPVTHPRDINLDQSGEPGTQRLNTAWAPDVQSISSFQETYRHFGNPEYYAAAVANGPFGERTLAQSDRMGEWMQTTGERGTVTGSLRWFWQQFPKEWEATDQQLTLHLWSPRAGTLDFGEEGLSRFLGAGGKKYLLSQESDEQKSPLQHYFFYAAQAAAAHDGIDGLGINKHHELFFHFGHQKDSARGAEYGSLAANQPLALATGEWNCSTNVFGPLQSRPGNPADEAIVDQTFDLSRYAQDTFGDYGWWLFGAGPHYSYHWDPETKRHYADARRFEYHTYQKETQLWWCYLRSGERKFYDWAIPSENHWVDIAVSHAPTTYFCDWKGGERDPRTLHWPRGDWSIDNPLHYVRHHNNAEAWLRGASQFWGSYHRTLETTSLAYYITGDERYQDVIEYWREYWGNLAGKTNASTDIAPWYQEQAWYRLPAPGEAPQTWAEMIRDYAPFSSGSRHQMTLFFNLATLYEHTWDPQAGKALDDYAAAFLDPAHRMGIWRSQDNRLPANYEGPSMLHFWAPALWKYARVTQDPRMPAIFRGLYHEAYAADPFRESESIGVYSNSYPGYAYYHTQDPRHLTIAQLELGRLRPFAEPLEKPEDLGRRIYNPYATISTLAATPRLSWALAEASRQGVDVPAAPPLPLQRTAISFAKSANIARTMTLWGFDSKLTCYGPDGKPISADLVETEQHASPLSPFDRTMPEFEAFLHHLTIPADFPAGNYTFAPQLELGILADSGKSAILTNAARPLRLRTSDVWRIRIPEDKPAVIVLESARPTALTVSQSDNSPVTVKAEPLSLIVDLSNITAGTILEIANHSPQPAWFQLRGVPEEFCWGTFQNDLPEAVPERTSTLAALPSQPVVDPNATYIPGRFGKALFVKPGTTITLPDHVDINGEPTRLFDMKQGTIEFWVKRMWDERLTPDRKPVFLTNGLVQAWSPWKLPLHAWSHVAIVWRPAKRDPNLTIVHVYVDGLDQANYRSTWWPGYGDRPFSFPSNGKWLSEFRIRGLPDAPFAIDDLRISSVPRYANLDVIFGNRLTYNPFRFKPSTSPAPRDDATFLLFPFDDSLEDQADWQGHELIGKLLAP